MRRVRLTLDDPVLAAQAVDLSYALPGSGRIQDLAGNDAAALTNETVTNLTGTDEGDVYMRGDFDTGRLSDGWYWDYDVPPSQLGSAALVPGLEGGSTYAWWCRASSAIDSGSGAGPVNMLGDRFDAEYERPGRVEFGRFLCVLPSSDGDYPGVFIVPSSGNWHTILSWHEPANAFGYPAFRWSPHFGLNGSSGGRPSFFIQWGGGPFTNGLIWHWDEDEDRNPIPIIYDHIYEIVFEVGWTHLGSYGDSDGYVNVTIDGRQFSPPPSGVDIYGNPWPTEFPTLWRYENHPLVGPSHPLYGSYGPTWNALGTYRGNTGTPAEATETSVILDSFVKGSTLASVGG